jgi:hypothetical protein
MRIALVLLFLLCGVGVFAESQPVTEKTINSKPSTEQIQRGSENLPFIVKTIQPSKSQEESEKDAEERQDRKILNILTFSLAGIGAMQLFVFGLQARRLRETVKATEKAAEAAKKQTEVAINEFISTHRPKIIIRSVTIEPPTHPALPIEEGKPLKIQAVAVNIGDTPTEIIESNITILVGGPKFDALTPFGPVSNNINKIKLVPGGAWTFWVTAEQVDFKNTPQIISLKRGEKVIYFFGFISYRDDIGNMRRTAFCRKYNPETERFDQTNDPDYEYVD